MTPEQRQLLARIMAFPLGDPEAPGAFLPRLARENGWSPRRAARVADEYRRFAFLAVAAGHPVSPPDAVDQAWHLHLLHTRGYWGRFCPEALGRPLHHEPSRGGAAEAAKFADWYARTRGSYRRLFGEEPPADIWPPRADLPAARRVDPRTAWIVSRRGAATALAAALLTALATLVAI